MPNGNLYWVGYAIIVGALLLTCIVVIAKSLADLYFAMYGREGRPSEPDLDTRVWYRDWECRYSHDAAAWTGLGWYACLGGEDLDCTQVTAATWDELLDEVDDYMDLTTAGGMR